MNRQTLIALILPLAFSTAVFADDGGGASADASSEFNHQADAGKWEVTPGFTFGSIKSNWSNASQGGISSTTDSMTDMFIKGEYGINEMFSVGLMLGYQSDSYSYSPSQGAGNAQTKADGMTDPMIYFMGRNNVGPGSIHYGIDWTFALAKGQINTTSTNEYDGGMTFTPFVSYEMMMGPGIFGLKTSYDLIKTNGSYQDNTQDMTMTIKNGQVFTLMAFYEMNFDPVIWGVDLGLVNHAPNKFTEGTDSGSLSNGSNTFNIATYANWSVTPDIHILPTIGWGVIDQAFASTIPSAFLSAGNLSSIDGIYGTIAARFAF